MLELTAVFESWHIPDGNYPPLYRGMSVKLAFQIEPLAIAPALGTDELRLVALGNAEYDFCGQVIRAYPQLGRRPLAVIDTGDFCFYIEGEEEVLGAVGARVAGRGTLLLDYYIWKEQFAGLPGAPNLFYPLQVTRIRRVRIPERFISRHARGKSLPTRVSPANFGTISDIDSMEGQALDEKFCLVDFRQVDSIP